jgi:TfoX/Sxy family transcriptional regulator of competence genes
MPDRPTMPTFGKAPPQLVERFGTTLADFPEAPVRKMFGYPAAFVNGNMATGLHEANWFVRLPGDAEAELRAAGGRPFEPMAGRPMRGYTVLPPSIVADEAALTAWVGRVVAYVATLPPKAAKG